MRASISSASTFLLALSIASVGCSAQAPDPGRGVSDVPGSKAVERPEPQAEKSQPLAKKSEPPPQPEPARRPRPVPRQGADVARPRTQAIPAAAGPANAGTRGRSALEPEGSKVDVVTVESYGVSCDQIKRGPVPRKLSVSSGEAPVFIYPRVLPTPLATLTKGAVLDVGGTNGKWFLVRFGDRRWGPRVGYINCANVIATLTDALP